MIQSLEDQGALKNIADTLTALVQDIKASYAAYGVPTDEIEIRKLIWTVNETAIAKNQLEDKALEGLKI